MAKRPDIVHRISSMIPPARAGHWYMRGTPEQLDAIQQIAAAWKAGELGDSARAIAAPTAQVLAEHGVKVSQYMVREWLGKLKRS